MGPKKIVTLTLKDILNIFDCDERFVGNGPTYEVTGLATPCLERFLKRMSIPYEFFTASNHDHEDFGKQCIQFTWCEALCLSGIKKEPEKIDQNDERPVL